MNPEVIPHILAFHSNRCGCENTIGPETRAARVAPELLEALMDLLDLMPRWTGEPAVENAVRVVAEAGGQL